MNSELIKQLNYIASNPFVNWGATQYYVDRQTREIQSLQRQGKVDAIAESFFSTINEMENNKVKIISNESTKCFKTLLNLSKEINTQIKNETPVIFKIINFFKALFYTHEATNLEKVTLKLESQYNEFLEIEININTALTFNKDISINTSSHKADLKRLLSDFIDGKTTKEKLEDLMKPYQKKVEGLSELSRRILKEKLIAFLKQKNSFFETDEKRLENLEVKKKEVNEKLLERKPSVKKALFRTQSTRKRLETLIKGVQSETEVNAEKKARINALREQLNNPQGDTTTSLFSLS